MKPDLIKFICTVLSTIIVIFIYRTCNPDKDTTVIPKKYHYVVRYSGLFNLDESVYTDYVLKLNGTGCVVQNDTLVLMCGVQYIILKTK